MSFIIAGIISVPVLLVCDLIVGFGVDNIARNSNEPLSYLFSKNIDHNRVHYVFGNSRSVPVQKNFLPEDYSLINMSTNSMTSSTIIAMIKTLKQNRILNKDDIVYVEASSIFNSDECRTASYASAGPILDSHYKKKCLKKLAYLTPNIFKLNTESFIRMLHSRMLSSKQNNYPRYRAKNKDICNTSPTDLSGWTSQITHQSYSLQKKINELKDLKNIVPQLQFFSMPFPSSTNTDSQDLSLITNYLNTQFSDLAYLNFSKTTVNDCKYFSDTLHLNYLGGIKLGIQ